MENISVHSRLREERTRLGLEQKTVAAACDVAPKTVSRWESAIPIPADKLAVLEPLGFDVLYVVSGRHAVAAGASELCPRDADEAQWVRYWRAIRPEDRRFVVVTVRAWATSQDNAGQDTG